MVEKWLCNKGRHREWKTCVYLKVEPTYFWSYSYSSKLFSLYWLGSNESAEICSWQWCTPFVASLLPPSDCIFKTQFKNQVPTTLCVVSVGLQNFTISFTKKNIHVLHNYIPNRWIACHEKDPPWLNDYIKHLIDQKNEIFKKCLKDGRPNSVLKNLRTIAWDLTEAISISKSVYYERLANKLKGNSGQ